MVTEGFPPFATEISAGRTDSNQGIRPSFFTTASAPSMSVECPPLTFEPCTCPFFLPSPMLFTLANHIPPMPAPQLDGGFLPVRTSQRVGAGHRRVPRWVD